jgi:outer membrane protein OmpA-like peptidoglycan-associated protein
VANPLLGGRSAILAWVTVLAAGACAQRPASLDTAQAAIEAARADTDISTHAAAELNAAQRELQSAQLAWEEGEGWDEAAHRAALAAQQVEIARAVAEARKSQAEIESLDGQRERALREAAERQVQALRQEMAAWQARESERASREAAERQVQALRQEMASLQARESERASREAAERQAQRMLRQELAGLQARATERGIVLTVGDVLFDAGQATVTPSAIAEITRLARFVQENPDRMVRVEGYTDSAGSIETNLVLSQRRAEAVADALIAAGVDPARVVPVGHGPDFPIATNDTAAGRQRNRRVEVVIENPPGAAAARPGQAVSDFPQRVPPSI